MITGIDLSETKDYVSKFDRGEQKTVWKLSTLSSQVISYCIGSKQNMDLAIELVRFGLRGFENFKDKKGVHISFNTVSRPLNGRNYNVVCDEIVNIIPAKILDELGAELLSSSNMTDEEIKN